MPKLIMLIGPPGSGKSYFSEILKEHGYEIQSSDALRKKLFGSEDIQDKPWLVFKILHSNIIKGLKANKNEVYDACNTNKSSRKAIFKLLKNESIPDLEIIGVIMNTELNECIKRDSARTRTVGADVINDKFNDLKSKPPKLEEGFNELISVDEFKTKYL